MPEMKTWTANGTTFTLPFAPDGFGLGGVCATTDNYDANKAIENGFYTCLANTPDNNWWYVIPLHHLHQAYIRQIAFELQNNDGMATRISWDNGTSWSEWVDFGPRTFAPAGYGLGNYSCYDRTATSKEQLDTFKENGFWSYQSGDGNLSPNHAFGYCYGYTASYTPNYAKQFAFSLTDGTCIERSLISGNWGDWCFQNPPMIPGVEYRTTKRHNGKPVYTKLLSYSPGSFTSEYIYLLHDISNFDTGLSINVSWWRNGVEWRHFPASYHGDARWDGQVYWYGQGKLVFELGEYMLTNIQQSVVNILVTVEYTKTT